MKNNHSDKANMECKDNLSIENISLRESNKIFPETRIGPKRVRLGICCKNNFLRSQKETIFCSRSLTVATYLSSGPELAKEK